MNTVAHSEQKPPKWHCCSILRRVGFTIGFSKTIVPRFMVIKGEGAAAGALSVLPLSEAMHA